MSGKVSAVSYDNIFIGYHAVETYIIAGIGILEHDRVLYNGILADFYTSEEYGVFNRSFYHTAVGDKRI